jgi:DNA-binding NtrC family response regulator
MTAERVCIILNEREPTKERIAETLFKNLASQGIPSKRLKADPKLNLILKERTPKVLILDYIIGDYTTGLDVLAAVNEWDEIPVTIFLTDEPSVQVAVDAMKGGASDYLKLDNPEAISIIVETVNKAVKNTSLSGRIINESKEWRVKHLTANSPRTLQLQENIKAVAQSELPLIVIQGAAGVGRNTVAETILNERPNKGPITVADWSLYPNSAKKFFGLTLSDGNPNKLGNIRSFIVDKAEHDAGDLIKSFEELISTKPQWKSECRVVIGTSDLALAKMWLKILPGTLLTLPNLSERIEDLPELAQDFFNHATTFIKNKTTQLNPESIKYLAQCQWPGNLSQLKEVLFEAAVLSLQLPIELAVKQAYENYSNIKESHSRAIAPLEAEISFDRFCGDYRLAAMHLGTSIPQLYKLLNRD